jgi:hypothetical protein
MAESFESQFVTYVQDLLQQVSIEDGINYHPQSGWFEDTPLKGGAVMKGPRWGRCCRRPSAEGTVIACPRRGRCRRKPSPRALL